MNYFVYFTLNILYSTSTIYFFIKVIDIRAADPYRAKTLAEKSLENVKNAASTTLRTRNALSVAQINESGCQKKRRLCLTT